MPAPQEVVQKSSKEVELDLIFAEEFAADAAFANRFVAHLAQANPALQDFGPIEVRSVTPQPRLKDGGYGDLLVVGEVDDTPIHLLIEHKITAGPSTRQAERYNSHAQDLRAQGQHALTILVAPKRYVGESDAFDVRLNLESLIDLIDTGDAGRSSYKRARILRAIEKKNTSGVQVPDAAVLQLHSAYRAAMAQLCAQAGVDLRLPVLRAQYYDGDSWLEKIGHPDLPAEAELRHRLWVSVGSDLGQVDLILRRPTQEQRQRFAENAPDWARFTPYSKTGVQLSVPSPALKPHQDFAPQTVAQAFGAMARLVAWYLRR